MLKLVFELDMIFLDRVKWRNSEFELRFKKWMK